WSGLDTRDDAAASLRKRLLRLADREVAGPLRSLAQRPAEASHGERLREVVEARPEVSENVADDERELEGWLAEWFGVEDGEAGILVTLAGDSVGVRCR